MSNRITHMSMLVSRLSAAEAEIHIKIYVESVAATTHARGKLVGPRCAYAATVEIAHPLREISRACDPAEAAHITLRAIIPEPCLWDRESPFVYRCVVELLHDGQICDERSADYGLATPAR